MKKTVKRMEQRSSNVFQRGRTPHESNICLNLVSNQPVFQVNWHLPCIPVISQKTEKRTFNYISAITESQILIAIQYFLIGLKLNYSELQSMNTAELEAMDQKQRTKNKARLLTQNKKLNNEIRNLEKEMTQIVTARQNDLIRNYEQTNTELGKLREEITVQQKYMKKLKGQVEFLKSANTKGNAQFIIKQEDELLLLKKEYENLIVQRGVVNKFKDDKLKVLVKDKPFQDHKKSVEENLATVKKSNKTMQAEITALEREVRKFHNYIVLNNTLSRDKKQSSQLQYQIAKSDHEIKQLQVKTKEIEDKWKSQLEGLDNELFELKSNLTKTEAKLNQVQKEHRMWETRKNSLRYEDQILQFRDRLSKIQLLPQDKLFQNAIKSERKKQKLTASEIIKMRKSKILDDKKNSEPVKQQKIETQLIKETPVKNIEQTQSEQGKVKSNQQLSKNNNTLLRKSDKNIIGAAQQIKKDKQLPPSKDKEKDKQKGKEKDKQTDAKGKNNKDADHKQKIKPKQLTADKSKQKLTQLDSLKGKQKQKGKAKKDDSISKKQIEPALTDKNSPTKNDKKSPQKADIKSEQGDNKKENPKNGAQITKQKSQVKLDKSKQKQKQASPKKQEKQKGKDQKIQAQIKQDNPRNEGNKKSKQSSPKPPKNQEKKPTKLILKSVGVGTG